MTTPKPPRTPKPAATTPPAKAPAKAAPKAPARAAAKAPAKSVRATPAPPAPVVDEAPAPVRPTPPAPVPSAAPPTAVVKPVPARVAPAPTQATRVVEEVREPEPNVPVEIGRVLLIALQVVLIVMAFVVLLGIIFTGAPTNPDNVIVRNGLARAEDLAGPFKDVFTPEGGNKELYANYVLAIGVYLVLAFVVGKVTEKLAKHRKRTPSS